MATIRNLKIKTSTCKRLVKEFHSYEKEVEREAAKTADMKEKGADPHDLKQQENVLAESRMMIPDCLKRLEAALADLKGTLLDVLGLMIQWLRWLGKQTHSWTVSDHEKSTVFCHSHPLAELEEANQKEGPEIDDARSTIAEVEQFFQTAED